MWITLLLITRATCEWVEISQHHYRKPAKTQSADLYPNQTISQVWIDQRKTNTRSEFSSGKKVIPDIDEDLFVYKDIKSAGKKEAIGVVERVSNIGIIRRVDLPNTPVKSPIIQTTSDANKMYTNYEVSLENLDNSEELHRRVFYNKRKQEHATEAIPHRDATKITFRNYSVMKREPNHFVTLNTGIANEDAVSSYHSKGKTNKITKSENKVTTASEIHSIKPNFVTTENTDENIIHEPVQRGKRKPNSDGNRVENNESGDKFEENKTNFEGPTTEETPVPNSKRNTMEVLMKVMKTVADTISKNSHRSLNSKLHYLHELKNTMLDNIENRIDAIWPDETDAQNGAKRRSRSAQDDARGHVEFPSSESALMTISFLTFAVFLIKLVLQVIQTYKNKAMMVSPLVVATAGRSAMQRLQTDIKQNN